MDIHPNILIGFFLITIALIVIGMKLFSNKKLIKEPVEPVINLFDATPRSLRDAPAIDERMLRLQEPHIFPLTQYVENLRNTYPDWEFPYFDPADGGVNAKLLFLFEKPGPMTATGKGSGFISRNNDDPTADATFSFMQEAKIPRHETVIWNTIPGWNGKIDIPSDELRFWIESKEINKLINLLPNLKAIVFVGRKAEKASSAFEAFGVEFYFSAHPSRRVQNSYPQKWSSIPNVWRAAYEAVKAKGD